MTNTHAAQTTAPTYVALFHNVLNTSYYQITPLADGMERVEHIGREHADRPQVERLALAAESMARVTGSTSATYREEIAGGELVAELTWHRNWTWITEGVHRARVNLDPAQAALKAEAATQGEPVKGARYIVSELTGYQPPQNRGLDHRHCHCGSGVTTYKVGTVTEITHWADNSIEATVELEEGGSRTVQMVAPHGDVCF